VYVFRSRFNEDFVAINSGMFFYPSFIMKIMIVKILEFIKCYVYNACICVFLTNHD
jgi:hypothetical protein